MELEALRIGLEARTQDRNGLIDFVHLHVGRSQILMRYGTIGVLLEGTLKKRDCIFRIAGMAAKQIPGSRSPLRSWGQLQ